MDYNRLIETIIDTQVRVVHQLGNTPTVQKHAAVIAETEMMADYVGDDASENAIRKVISKYFDEAAQKTRPKKDELIDIALAVKANGLTEDEWNEALAADEFEQTDEFAESYEDDITDDVNLDHLVYSTEWQIKGGGKRDTILRATGFQNLYDEDGRLVSSVEDQLRAHVRYVLATFPEAGWVTRQREEAERRAERSQLVPVVQTEPPAQPRGTTNVVPVMGAQQAVQNLAQQPTESVQVAYVHKEAKTMSSGKPFTKLQMFTDNNGQAAPLGEDYGVVKWGDTAHIYEQITAWLGDLDGQAHTGPVPCAFTLHHAPNERGYPRPVAVSR